MPAQKERGVDQSSQIGCEESLSEKVEVSYPKQAFGSCSTWYWSFLDALLSGLSAYEALVEGNLYATQPLPVA